MTMRYVIVWKQDSALAAKVHHLVGTTPSACMRAAKKRQWSSLTSTWMLPQLAAQEFSLRLCLPRRQEQPLKEND
jgi:hypothetical protein